ncbi:MAG: hemN [Flavipsychrobacter sp.]|jgi:oxygen-independent coproporphyrinogen-3 oxidase|nr:hemN [Flavipsychrobacter sp.]
MIADRYLLTKYNVPVPRYTSYPTVPYWQDNIDAAKWLAIFGKDFMATGNSKGISLYIHLPFCESLCTYCGCNKKITTNHAVEGDYIDAIHKEWALYLSHMHQKPIIRELHLGGGTPTFFSPANLRRLLMPILNMAVIHDEHDFSFEGHPNNTTREHLQTLYDIGFRRVSYGVQDNDPEVQRLINRSQPFSNVQRVIETAREIGYKSVNFDLIYGLPGQTMQTIKQTARQVISLLPDRIAFYSYAHVPWTSRGQRLFDEDDLPGADEKLNMYAAAKELFVNNGYIDIGMDHFARENDDLNVAFRQGRLHRNFMGYTTQNTDILIGLGVSSISATPGAFVQNEKILHNYYQKVGSMQLAVVKGLFLNDEDRRFGRYILDLICNGYTTIADCDVQVAEQFVMPLLKEFETDRLVSFCDGHIHVTDTGKRFVRNICSAFDLYIARQKAAQREKMFSKAV